MNCTMDTSQIIQCDECESKALGLEESIEPHLLVNS